MILRKVLISKQQRDQCMIQNKKYRSTIYVTGVGVTSTFGCFLPLVGRPIVCDWFEGLFEYGLCISLCSSLESGISLKRQKHLIEAKLQKQE